MKLNFRIADKAQFMPLAFILILGSMYAAFCCGGGYVAMPYIPAGGTGNANASSKGSFFIIDKGTVNSMFDVKTLQPLFRNVHMSGNERTNMDKIRNNQRTFDSRMSGTNSNPMAKNPNETPVPVPVLNLQRIH
jgi:hypothetical protein